MQQNKDKLLLEANGCRTGRHEQHNRIAVHCQGKLKEELSLPAYIFSCSSVSISLKYNNIPIESAIRRCPIKYILDDQSVALHRRPSRLLFPSTTVTSSIVLTSVFVLGKSASAAKLRGTYTSRSRRLSVHHRGDMVVDMHLIKIDC